MTTETSNSIKRIKAAKQDKPNEFNRNLIDMTTIIIQYNAYRSN